MAITSLTIWLFGQCCLRNMFIKNLNFCISTGVAINSLPNDKKIGLSESNAFADDKIKVIENLKFVLGRVENTVRKGENAGYRHFLLFPHSFLKASFSGSSK